MKYLILAVAFSLSTSMTIAKEVRIDPGKVLDIVTTDWNNDGQPDKAILVQNADDTSELFVYLSADDFSGLKLALQKTNITWTGRMWGTQPSLALNKADSLLIMSGNTAVGRTRWEKKLTVAYRDKQFIVAGYTYKNYDTLAPDSSLDCDVNLLTGKGINNNKPFRNKPINILLKNWSEKHYPHQCRP